MLTVCGFRLHRAAGALLGIAALSTLSIGAAGAAGTSGGGPSGASAPKSAMAATTGGSGWLAGYRVTPADGLASASVTFKMPTLDCSTDVSGNEDSVSFGVYTDDLADFAMAEGICEDTSPALYGFQIQTPAGSFNEPGLNPGDTVLTYVAQTAGYTIAEVKDVTTGVHWESAYGANKAEKTIDIGAYEALRNGYEIPPFTKATFSHAELNGDFLGYESPSRVNAHDQANGHEVISTGSLTTGTGGSAFSTTFISSF